MFSKADSKVFSDEGMASKVHECVRHKKGPVWFLLAARGNSLDVHIAASGRDGRRDLRQAVADLVAWVPGEYRWCKMITATITDANKSAQNLAKKTGWKYVGRFGSAQGAGSIYCMPIGDNL